MNREHTTREHPDEGTTERLAREVGTSGFQIYPYEMIYLEQGF